MDKVMSSVNMQNGRSGNHSGVKHSMYLEISQPGIVSLNGFVPTNRQKVVEYMYISMF